jgi:hypothetical protein
VARLPCLFRSRSGGVLGGGQAALMRRSLKSDSALTCAGRKTASRTTHKMLQEIRREG